MACTAQPRGRKSLGSPRLHRLARCVSPDPMLAWAVQTSWCWALAVSHEESHSPASSPHATLGLPLWSSHPLLPHHWGQPVGLGVHGSPGPEAASPRAHVLPMDCHME